MENDFLKVIETRRSCRKYKPEQITDEELKAVLEAGTYAPTSRGMQSPYIVAVQKKEVLARLAKMNAEIMGVTSNPYYDAPTYVLVFAPSLANNPRKFVIVNRFNPWAKILRFSTFKGFSKLFGNV